MSVNYSIPLALVSLGALVAAASKWILRTDSQVCRASVFALAVLIGQVAYMLAVPQASGIHIYFQYFFAVPIAFGGIVLVDLITDQFMREYRAKAWFAVFGVLFALTAAYTAYQYHELLVNSSSADVTDIELIRSLKDIPADKNIIAVDTSQEALFWYDNPNIEYYAGRSIKGYLLDNGFPVADYQIVPRAYVDQFMQQINDLHGFGRAVSATNDRCSTNLCLLHLVTRTGSR
jgi:hypothetical protein